MANPGWASRTKPKFPQVVWTWTRKYASSQAYLHFSPGDNMSPVHNRCSTHAFENSFISTEQVFTPTFHFLLLGNSIRLCINNKTYDFFLFSIQESCDAAEEGINTKHTFSSAKGDKWTHPAGLIKFLIAHCIGFKLLNAPLSYPSLS